MAAVPVAMAAGSSLLQGFGQYQQASAEADRMRAEASQLDSNARVNDQQTNLAEGLQRRRADALLGEQRASIAQSGFGSGGTMGDIARQSGIEASLDALATRYEGNVRSASMRGQAEQNRWGAKQTKRAAGIGLATSLISGASSAYGAYAATGGTPDKLGYSILGPKNVMRSSAIPGGFSQANSASRIIGGY